MGWTTAGSAARQQAMGIGSGGSQDAGFSPMVIPSAGIRDSFPWQQQETDPQAAASAAVLPKAWIDSSKITARTKLRRIMRCLG